MNFKPHPRSGIGFKHYCCLSVCLSVRLSVLSVTSPQHRSSNVYQHQQVSKYCSIYGGYIVPWQAVQWHHNVTLNTLLLVSMAYRLDPSGWYACLFSDLVTRSLQAHISKCYQVFFVIYVVRWKIIIVD